MNAHRVPLFCDTALAGRIERVEAQLIAKGSEAAHRRRADGAGFVLPIAGGVASFAEEDSPLNKVAGLGFGGLPSAAALDGIERAFAACGAPVQVELAHLGDPAIGTLLTERGYRLASYENVLGRALGGDHEQVAPPGSRSGRAATTSSTGGSTSSRRDSPTPTREGSPPTRSFPVTSSRGPYGIWRRQRASCATSHCSTG
ncbi:hypothetical protein GCM10025734_13890 [Kitasatospora paranensis]